MSLTLVPPPPPAGQSPAGHPVVRFTASLAGAIDRLAEVPIWSMTPEEERQALVELRRQRSPTRGTPAAGAGAGRPRPGRRRLGGDVDTGLAGARHEDHHRGRAPGPAPREKLDQTFHATRAAFAAGLIDVEKAAIVTSAVEALTEEYDDLPAGTRERAEAHMVDQAKAFDAPTLKQLGKRLFEVVCPEAADASRRPQAGEGRGQGPGARALQRPRQRRRHQRRHVQAAHPARPGLLKKALEAITSPRRIGEGRLDPETGKKLPHSTLLGHGLMELVENHLSDLPSVNGSPFTLVVTLGYDALISGLGVAVTDTGRRISAAEARRLACKAGIIPMVLDGKSMPLDLGREQRLFDRYQKIAINNRYNGCAARQLRPAAGLGRVPPRGALEPGRRDGRQERHLVVPRPPPDGRPPRGLRHEAAPNGQDPVQPADVGRTRTTGAAPAGLRRRTCHGAGRVEQRVPVICNRQSHRQTRPA